MPLTAEKKTTSQIFLRKHGGSLTETNSNICIDLMVEIEFSIFVQLFSMIWTGLITGVGQRFDSQKIGSIRNCVVLQ